MKTSRLFLAAFATTMVGGIASADLVVDTDLGTLGSGAHSVTGDTTGGNNNVTNYPGFTTPASTWLEEVVFQFNIASAQSYQLTNNSIAGDPDFFLLNSTTTTNDGTHDLADGPLAADFLDGGADGAALTLGAGTYYLVVDAFGGALPGNSAANLGAFDVTLNLSTPPMETALGGLMLDDGSYDRAAGGTADHPYGVMAFSVDTTGTYDIQGDWDDGIGGTFDGFLYLFDNPFAEDDSLNIALDDDFGGTAASRIEGTTLNAGQTYYLVGTTFGAETSAVLSGDITISGPGAATLVPEPGSLALLGLGGLALLRRRR